MKITADNILDVDVQRLVKHATETGKVEAEKMAHTWLATPGYQRSRSLDIAIVDAVNAMYDYETGRRGRRAMSR